MSLDDKHSLRSSEREEYIEYIFLAQLCGYGWPVERFVEVSRAQTDAHGYDLVLSCDGITRHVQLKASKSDGSVRFQKVNSALANKPSGCVVWIKVDPDTLNPEVFGWFGQSAGKPIGNLGLKVAKHTKANAQGKKLERPKLRELRWSNFDEIKGVDELFSKLFDPCDQEDK